MNGGAKNIFLRNYEALAHSWSPVAFGANMTLSAERRLSLTVGMENLWLTGLSVAVRFIAKFLKNLKTLKFGVGRIPLTDDGLCVCVCVCVCLL